jgi:S-adenosylmethionine/arginine decarboxylase-like enzyme
MKNTAEEKNKAPWGHQSCIDLYDCNPETIRDAAKIKQFVAEMCILIDMKPFGETKIVHFGDNERVAGFSMTQLIETSLISAHFANQTNTVYLDVFSCKYYDSEKASDFAKRFFEAKETRLQIISRI